MGEALVPFYDSSHFSHIEECRNMELIIYLFRQSSTLYPQTRTSRRIQLSHHVEDPPAKRSITHFPPVAVKLPSRGYPSGSESIEESGSLSRSVLEDDG